MFITISDFVMIKDDKITPINFQTKIEKIFLPPKQSG